MVFEADVIRRHRAARVRSLIFLAKARVLVVLTAPFIYGLIVPFVILDLCVILFQAVCFPAYGIPKVPRPDFTMIDRQQLGYLNGLQKFNCVYCGYANGLIAWVREVGSRTEAYWCPIKHARRISEPHLRYPTFGDFGNEKRLEELREGLKKSNAD